ncbi:MAG: arginyltransferase [Gammaproteobacteria bacterium]|nr:arginyltransferase [Gammaproteobacteria bacterium]
MTQDSSAAGTLQQLAFYTTEVHPCAYLADREAVNLLADPAATMSTETYSTLINLGFRRSGSNVYRPHCPHCQQCIPVRVPVNNFSPSRSQRRVQRLNQDLSVTIKDAKFQQEHYDLYRRYIHSRHAGEGMDSDDPEQYARFLISDWCDTRFVEFRCQQNLLAVAVMDYLPGGLSAVYTFFEPDTAKRSLGSYAILWGIQQTQQLKLPHLYLGYWIEQSPKMSYKSNYRPLEGLHQNDWRPI